MSNIDGPDSCKIDAAFAAARAKFDNEGLRWLLIVEEPDNPICGARLFCPERPNGETAWTNEDLVDLYNRLLAGQMQP